MNLPYLLISLYLAVRPMYILIRVFHFFFPKTGYDAAIIEDIFCRVLLLTSQSM